MQSGAEARGETKPSETHEGTLKRPGSQVTDRARGVRMDDWFPIMRQLPAGASGGNQYVYVIVRLYQFFDCFTHYAPTKF